MAITIKEDGRRFGVRVGAIIYNEDKTKILLENPKENLYMFPGGRIEMFEESDVAIKRELKEELNLDTNLKLKYIAEMILNIPSGKYHEIGFYYLVSINESEIPNGFNSLDGDSVFKWVPILELDKYNILGKPIKLKIINKEITNDNVEHITYKEQ